jgi:acetyltransferase-like isoleucine patch superfamily enzyme
MIVVYYINRFIKKIRFKAILFFNNIFKYIVLYGNNVHFGKRLITNGMPNIDVWRYGTFIIGDDLQLNNGERFNMIGRQQKCNFVVMHNAELVIGNGVGMSSTTIVCSTKVIVGDFVKIGGNTVIFDTDFHSLDKDSRKNKVTDIPKKSPIIIGNNVFIGAHCTIL